MAKLTTREILSVAAVAGSTAVLVIVVGLAARGWQAGSGSSAPFVSPLSGGITPPPVARVVVPAPLPPPPPRRRAGTSVEAARPASKPPPSKPATNTAFLPGGSLSVTARAAQTDAAHVVVLVSGAVARPGVYTLARGARVADALRAAGGATSPAALSSLSLPLNRPLRHADQVHVPPIIVDRQNKRVSAAATERVAPASPRPPARTVQPLRPGGANAKPVLPPAPAEAATTTPKAAPSGDDAPNPEMPAPTASATGVEAVNLNTADEVTLQKRLGVGPQMAARIVAHRREVGGFTSPEQLRDVPGMTDARFDALQGRVRVE